MRLCVLGRRMKVEKGSGGEKIGNSKVRIGSATLITRKSAGDWSDRDVIQKGGELAVQ